MRRVLAVVLSLAVPADPVLAGIPPPPPDPARCGFELSGQTAPCQFRFNPNGAFDALTVAVTLRDMWDTPIPTCSTSCSIEGVPSGTVWCHCSPDRQAGFTDTGGVAEFVFGRIGGRGQLAVHVTAHYADLADYWVGSGTLEFTSSDLNGSCEPAPDAVTILDLGLWAGCYPPGPYCRYSDYDCDGVVNVVDLGMWAMGLGSGCDGPCP